MHDKQERKSRCPDTGGHKETGTRVHQKGDSPDRRLIVGIGASAGGLSALQRFFRALPEGDGLTFVVVVHLDPHRESSLAEILQRQTSMKVVQVSGTTHLEPNHVFVIPPDRTLSATDNQLTLAAFDEPRGRRAPIDVFFRTLAETHKENAVAVILSGGDTDGTVGLRSVKDLGGIVLVQAPEDAEHEGMPRSAINTGLADLVLPVEELAQRILQYRENEQPTNVPRDSEHLPADQGDILNRLLALLRTQTGQDFTQYKTATILRRIGRRMRVNQVSTLEDYLNLLRSVPGEAKLLQRELLIGVTHFFRDPNAWEELEDQVISRLVEKAEQDRRIRVWVPGCATGEEAYSLAILLREQMKSRELPEVQVFASDLDDQALAVGRHGLYPDAIRADVSEERLRRFFTQEGDHFRIKKEIRDRVLFSPHSLFKDPPFSRLDLISCRNLLIYLNRDLQRNVFRLFHYALKPGGYLFLGSAETVESEAGLFEPVDRKHRIYRRMESAKRPELPALDLSGRTSFDLRLGEFEKPKQTAVDEAKRHRRVLEESAPPSVLVRRNYELLHLSGSAGRYLKRPGGGPSNDILEEIRPELRALLQRALHAAFEGKVASSSRPVEVQFNGESGWVHLIVRPQRSETEKPDVALVIFAEVDTIIESDPDRRESGEHPGILQLEDKVHRLHQQLQNTIEEYESSREEMKASNEELQSIAEEYKSTSEELETSKEELQSVNEELETVNQELKNKVEELSQSNSDLQNLMDSSDVDTLFLDRELRIQRFTPRLSDIFHIVPGDQGRPINHLTHQLDYDDFVGDAEQVLRSLVPIDRKVRRRGNGWYLVRVRPYRTVDERIDGIVATFVDITALKSAEEQLRIETEYSDLIVDTVRESLLVLDAQLNVVLANRSFYESFRVSPDETLGRALYRFADGQWDIGEFKELLEQALQDTKGIRSFQLEHDFKKIGRRVILLDVRRIAEKQLILLSMEDITERAQAEASLKELNRTLEQKVAKRSREIREMTLCLAKAEEVEQRRIAGFLHDDLQQRVYAVQLQAGALRSQLREGHRDAALERANKVEAELGEILELTRNLNKSLTPPALEHDLAKAALWLGERLKALYRLQVEFHAEDSLRIRDFEHRVLLFQSLRELLFNTVKHSGVMHATVEFAKREGGFVITVRDEGCGFDTELARQRAAGGEHLGLSSIDERLKVIGGEMKITSAPGEGTQVDIYLPESQVEE